MSTNPKDRRQNRHVRRPQARGGARGAGARGERIARRPASPEGSGDGDPRLPRLAGRDEGAHPVRAVRDAARVQQGTGRPVPGHRAADHGAPAARRQGQGHGRMAVHRPARDLSRRGRPFATKPVAHAPKLQPLFGKIGWAHNLRIRSRGKDAQEREFYLRMTYKFGGPKRALAHQIDTQSYKSAARTNQARPDADARPVRAGQAGGTRRLRLRLPRTGQAARQTRTGARDGRVVHPHRQPIPAGGGRQGRPHRPVALPSAAARAARHRTEDRRIRAGIRRQDAVLSAHAIGQATKPRHRLILRTEKKRAIVEYAPRDTRNPIVAAGKAILQTPPKAQRDPSSSPKIIARPLERR